MSKPEQKDWFCDIETIVKEPLKFKAKLAIGEEAYASLRLKNAVFEIWDVAGVATSAAAVAKTSIVASTFFAPTGWLAAIGIGSTAVTPVGWLIAAGVVTGGAWFGATRYLKSATQNRVIVIPTFINTPLDVLALGLFDLLAPMALKVANIDGEIADAERKTINDYFVGEWGYDARFVNEGLAYTESRLAEFSVKELAQTLAELQKKNPDCNYKSMSQEILQFLNNIIESDGKIDEREEMAIEKVRATFKEVDQIHFKKIAKNGFKTIKEAAFNLPLPGMKKRTEG